MSVLSQLLDPISNAAATALKSVSDAAEKLTTSSSQQQQQKHQRHHRSASSVRQSRRCNGTDTASQPPPLLHAPRSSSLPPFSRTGTSKSQDDINRKLQQQRMNGVRSDDQMKRPDDDVEATFDFMAKVPTLGMFGFGGLWDWSKGGDAQASSDEECDSREELELIDFKRYEAPNGETLPLPSDRETELEVDRTRSSEKEGNTGWGGAFGLNRSMPVIPLPAFPGLKSTTNSEPVQGDPVEGAPLRSPSPDTSAGTTAASAWSKAWSSITGANTKNLRSCGHKHPFHFFEGDLVLLGGMYGSFLSDRKTGKKAWLTMDAVLGFAPVDVGLSIEDVEDRLVPSGILDRVGPINVCADLVREFTAQAECSNGSFRFHPFGYDWRRDLDVSASRLEKHLESIFSQNGGQKITVIAHSMGGLVTLAVVNRRPELFRGVVFVGTPFGGVPTILWQLKKGIPFPLNKDLMSPDLHFGARSSFVFLPMDGRALVVDSKNSPDGEDDYLVDFYSADEWINHTLSQTLYARKPDEIASHKEYLQKTLHSAKTFRQSLAFDPEKQYPPLTHLVSTNWPTATRIKCSTTMATPTLSSLPPPDAIELQQQLPKPKKAPPRVETKYQWPTRFEPGDGVVARDAMTLPPGFEPHYIDTRVGHWGLLNEMRGIRACLKKIVHADAAGTPSKAAAPAGPFEDGEYEKGKAKADPAQLDTAGDIGNLPHPPPEVHPLRP
ncbi:hypothetical protein DFJ77DRAFT_669 [Powellomyces hirtus]|nr:hypothetical protein DFJ77DRAFT_669 [Powellomyces hirtus]